MSREPYDIFSIIEEGFLIIGGKQIASSQSTLDALNIKYIVNVAVELPNSFPENYQYLRLDLEDEVGEVVLDKMESVFTMIEKAKSENVAVLVHCSAGISRSSTFIIAYLMKHKTMTLREAFTYVKERRKIILPNEGFMKQLILLENQIYGKVSMTVEDYYVDCLASMGVNRDFARKLIKDSGNDFELAVKQLFTTRHFFNKNSLLS